MGFSISNSISMVKEYALSFINIFSIESFISSVLNSDVGYQGGGNLDPSYTDSNIGDSARPVWGGRCIQFDGTDDYIQSKNDFHIEYNDFTFSFWFKFHELANRDLFTTHPNGYLQTDIDGKLILTFESLTQTLTGSLEVDTFHHVAFSFDRSGDVSYYLNGTLVEAIDISADIGTDATAKQHAFSYNPSALFDGQVYDARFWIDTALDATEIAKVYNFQDTAVLPTYWIKCDETNGDTLNGSVGDHQTFTAVNYTENSFYIEDIGVKKSWRNDVGYSGVGVDYYPRDEANIENDTFGDSLEFSGSVAYDFLLKKSNCATFDGTNDFIDLSGISVTVTEMSFYIKQNAISQSLFSTSFFGAGQIYVNNIGLNVSAPFASVTYEVDGLADLTQLEAGDILQDLGWHFVKLNFTALALTNFFIGRSSNVFYGNFNLADFKMKNSGTLILHLPLAEGWGNLAYEVKNGGSFLATNITESAFWANKQNYYHYNLLYGFEYFDEDGGANIIRVPYKTNGSPIGTTISGYTNTSDNVAGYWHNDAETILNAPESPKMRVASIAEGNQFLFLTDSTVKDLTYALIDDDVNNTHFFFADISVANQKKNLLIFDEVQSGIELASIQNFLNH